MITQIIGLATGWLLSDTAAVDDAVTEGIGAGYGGADPGVFQPATGVAPATIAAAEATRSAGLSCRTLTQRPGGSSYWRTVQNTLCNRGYNPGVIDGVVGSNTRSAIRALQQAVGLSATGRVDTATGVRLGVAAESGAGSGGGTTQTSSGVTLTPGGDDNDNDDTGSSFARFFSASNPTMWLTLAGVMLMGGGVVYGVVSYRKSQAAQLAAGSQAAQLSAHSMPPTLVEEDMAAE